MGRKGQEGHLIAALGTQHPTLGRGLLEEVPPRCEAGLSAQQANGWGEKIRGVGTVDCRV